MKEKRKKQKKNYDDTAYLRVSPNPSWINSESTQQYGNKELSDILLFFVVYCPCKQYATQKRTLEYYNWKKKPWSIYRYLKGPLDNAAGNSFAKHRKMTNWVSVKEEIDHENHLDQHWYESRTEFAVYSNIETNEYMSLFYHIRCALAHGRFLITDHAGTHYYAFENGVTKGDKFFVKARIVLQEKTLLDWIKIITNGPIKEPNDDLMDVVEEMIANPSIRVDDLSKVLNIPDRELRRIIEQLKSSIDLKYERKAFAKPGFWVYDTQKFEQQYKKQQKSVS